MNKKSYKQKINESIKASEVDGKIDWLFNKPIGYLISRLCIRLHISANAVSVISLIIGSLGAVLLFYDNVLLSVIGVVLLIFANLLDSVDGMVARQTNTCTNFGRILDGSVSIIWFVLLSISLCCRAVFQNIYNLPIELWLFCVIAICLFEGYTHQRGAKLADYYKTFHVAILKNEVLDFDTSESLKNETSKNDGWIVRLFLKFYLIYVKSQEKFSKVFFSLICKFKNDASFRKKMSDPFINQSKKYIIYTNILQFNCRCIVLIISLIINNVFLYFVICMLLFGIIGIIMKYSYENLARKLLNNNKFE